jgi:hypothetical protein
MAQQATNLRQRVEQAAEAVLERDGSVGPLELLRQMQLLAPPHMQQWLQGNPHLCPLEPHIQGSQEKIKHTFDYFLDWAEARGLQRSEANYCRATPQGPVPVQVTRDGDPEREQFFRTHFSSPNLSPRKKIQVAKRLAKSPDIVVFELVSPTATCRDCGTEMWKGSLLYMGQGEPLCLSCADLDYLDFLPSGDAALTRRAKKYSRLSAVVVRFSRARKRYERQGILVTPEAIAQAEAECEGDAEQREARRAREAERRQSADSELVQQMTQTIRELFPMCPSDEARKIAEHTALRGSGRVGRSEAGRSCDPNALQLAVAAWVRHQHTNYDELLMRGEQRDSARDLIRPDAQQVLERWRNS